jgi:hypothetical protein
MVRSRIALLSAAAALLLQGCSSVTKIEGAVPNTTMALSGVGRVQLPQEKDLASKSTQQYEFMATAPSGQTLYGILPLRVNGGTMATSILFFAPALFIGGFRDVFPFYQVDPDGGVLRYKVKENQDWRQYKPTQAEIDRSKHYFDAMLTKCGADASKQPSAECASLASVK